MKALLSFLFPSPGKQLSRLGYIQHRKHVRETVDRMRSEMGLPAVKWGRL